MQIDKEKVGSDGHAIATVHRKPSHRRITDLVPSCATSTNHSSTAKIPALLVTRISDKYLAFVRQGVN